MGEKGKKEKRVLMRGGSFEDIDFRELARTVFGRRKFIAVVTGAVTLITLVVSLIMTPVFRSTAVILPISKSMPSFVEGGEMASFIGLLGLGGESNTAKIMAILQSVTIRETIIDKHGLMKILFEDEWDERKNRWEDEDEPPHILEGIREFEDIVTIEENKKTGAVSIIADFKDPVLSANISNWFVEELGETLKEKSFSIARHYRESVERILTPLKSGLADSEKNMTEFQKEKGMIVPEVQAEAMIKVYAELIKEKALREAKLKALKDALGSSTPEIKIIEAELFVIDKKIKEIEGSGKGSLMIPAGTLPEVGMEFAKKLRDLKISEKAYEELLVQYFLAKFQEAKEDVVFQVIDRAQPADEPERPKKLLYTAIAFAVSLLVATFYVIVTAEDEVEEEDEG